METTKTTNDRLSIDEAIALAGKVTDWTEEFESEDGFLTTYCSWAYKGKVGDAEIQVIKSNGIIFYDYDLIINSKNIKVFEAQMGEFGKVKKLYNKINSAYEQKEAEKKRNIVVNEVQNVKSLLEEKLA